MNQSFVFYKSFADAMRVMPADVCKRVLLAVADYAIGGIEPELEDWAEKAAFDLMRPQIDANAERREKAMRGGRPETGITAEEVTEAYEETGSWGDVAERFGVSRQTVYNIRQKKDEAEKILYGGDKDDDKEKDDEEDEDKDVEKKEDTEKGEDVNVKETDVKDVKDVKKLYNVKKPNANANVNANVNANEGERADKPPDTPPARFTRPTVDEVRAYCLERGNSVDAQRFCDFYASKGWRVGNQPMKDWRACVRTWEQRDRARGSPVRQTDDMIPDELLASL